MVSPKKDSREIALSTIRIRFSVENLDAAIRVRQYAKICILAQNIRSNPQKYHGGISEKTVCRARAGDAIDFTKACFIAEELGQPLEQLLSSATDITPELRRALDARYGAAAVSSESATTKHRDEPGTDDASATVGAPFFWMLGAIGSVAALIVLLLLFRPSLLPVNQPASATSDAAVKHYQIAAVIDEDLSAAARKSLWQGLQKTSSKQLQITANVSRYEDESLADLALRLGADGVLAIAVREQGRHSEWTVSYATDTGVHHLWYEAVPTAELQVNADALMGNAAAALNHHLGIAQPASVVHSGTADRAAFKNYMRGRVVLEERGAGSTAILNEVYRKQNFAVERDAEFAPAFAAQCEVLLRLYWVEDDQQFLKQARTACNKANKLLADYPYLLAVQALLDVRAGRAESALQTLKSKILEYPYSVDLKLASAEAAYSVYERGSNADAFATAIESLAAAIEMEPDNWAPHFWLGTYYLGHGDSANALAPLQAAAQLNPSELTLGNLGTVSLCHGSLVGAQKVFEDISNRFPYSHIGPEMLGTVYHYQQRYDEEIATRLRSLKKHSSSASPQVQEIHTALGDAYRLIGNQAEARTRYRRALMVIEADDAAGRITASDHAARAYLLAQLSSFAGNGAPVLKDAQDRILNSINNAREGGIGPRGHVMLAQAFELIGRHDAAQQEWTIAESICPLYAKHPENSGVDELRLSTTKPL